MLKRSLFLGLALGLAAVLPAEHGDGPQGGPGMKGRPGPMQKILRKLDLSKEQKDKLKALREARQEKNKATRESAQAARKELRELMGQADRSKAHEDKLKAKQAELMKLEQKLGQDRFEAMLELRGLLTDEQLKKFVELSAKMQEKGRERWGKGKHGKGDDHDDGKKGD